MSKHRLPDFLCCKPAPSNSPDITPHERYATGSSGFSALGAPAPALGFSSNRREHCPGCGAQDSIQHSWLSFPGVTRALLMAPLCYHSPGDITPSACAANLCQWRILIPRLPAVPCLKLPHGVSKCLSLLLSFSQVRPMGWAQAA